MESTLELLSTNSIDSKYNTFTPSVIGATGSATLLLYRVSASEGFLTDAFSVLYNSRLINNGDAGATVENTLAEFELNAASSANDDIKFNGYITSASMSVSTGELSTVSINFTVDGAFTDVFQATT